MKLRIYVSEGQFLKGLQAIFFFVIFLWPVELNIAAYRWAKYCKRTRPGGLRYSRIASSPDRHRGVPANLCRLAPERLPLHLWTL